MSTEILSPVTTPALLYPALAGGRLRPHAKHYQCPRCGGNLRSRLQAQIVRKSEVVFGFACDDCGKRWYLSSKLLLNEVLEDQIQKIYRFTHETKKEFGALLVKTPEGIRMDMMEIGEDMSVTFKKTKEYRKDEKIIGSIHAHPISDEFSDWDVATFLKDDWEKISIVTGADGTINVLVKTPETLVLSESQMREWIEENGDISLIEKADAYKFMLFKGKVNNLKLLAGGVSSSPFTSLEKLLGQIE
jgi:proteasome lid subunit RPN8/RPN11